MEIHEQSAVDILFRRLERERQALIEHYVSNKENILDCLEQSCIIEREMKKKLQEGLVDKERNREMQDLIAHYQSNEAEIYTFIECSCNIESKIETFIEFLDENTPTPVASVVLGIGVREAFLNLHDRATADRAIDVDDNDIVHHQ
eukprot:3267356-Ditylum_brightwellii.AAC.1